MSEPLPEAWQVITEIYTQELCVPECQWLQATPDPYATGDRDFVVSECTVPTPRDCPAFEGYVEDHQ